jgi:hypothetical protein
MAGALDTNISIEEAADIDAAVTTDAHLTAVIVGDVPSTAHRFREVAQSIPIEGSGRAQSWSSWNGGSSATGEVHPQTSPPPPPPLLPPLLLPPAALSSVDIVPLAPALLLLRLAHAATLTMHMQRRSSDGLIEPMELSHEWLLNVQ